MKNTISVGMLALLLTAVGCGGASVPNQQLTTAESAVRAAEVSGAEKLPRGQLHLKYAREQIVEAKNFIEQDENELATYALERAEVDAELALALAQNEKAQRDAQEQLNRIKELMEEK